VFIYMCVCVLRACMSVHDSHDSLIRKQG